MRITQHSKVECNAQELSVLTGVGQLIFVLDEETA